MNKYKRRKSSYKLLIFRLKNSKYYPLVIDGVIILFSIILVIFAIIPLIQSELVINKMVNEHEAQLQTLKNNIQYLSTVPDTKVDEDMSIASIAYPQAKDFNSAIKAIDASSIKSNVNIVSFSLAVGSIAKGIDTTSDLTGIPISLSIQGSASSISEFLKELATKIPLFSVTSLDFQQGLTTMIVNAIYQPYTAKNIDLSASAIMLSSQTQSLLDQFSQWNISEQSLPQPIQSASSSGSLPPF